MGLIIIREPIWKNHSVGIAETKMRDIFQVKISYKNKQGERLYPDRFLMTKAQALKYPVQYVKGNRLRIIPIADFKIL